VVDQGIGCRSDRSAIDVGDRLSSAVLLDVVSDPEALGSVEAVERADDFAMLAALTAEDMPAVRQLADPVVPPRDLLPQFLNPLRAPSAICARRLASSITHLRP
jgi:hypothetical protein